MTIVVYNNEDRKLSKMIIDQFGEGKRKHKK